MCRSLDLGCAAVDGLFLSTSKSTKSSSYTSRTNPMPEGGGGCNGRYEASTARIFQRIGDAETSHRRRAAVSRRPASTPSHSPKRRRSAADWIWRCYTDCPIRRRGSGKFQATACVGISQKGEQGRHIVVPHDACILYRTPTVKSCHIEILPRYRLNHHRWTRQPRMRSRLASFIASTAARPGGNLLIPCPRRCPCSSYANSQ